jgi:hypothetical protein
MNYDNLRIGNRNYVIDEVNFRLLEFLYTYIVLPFNMEAQTRSNWCWAATSKSVSDYYSWMCQWTQCKVASAELSKTCCDSPLPTGCNVPWYLDKALQRTKNFVSIQSGTITWQKVKDELNKGLVVGARIGWSGGGGHFMVIHGVSRVGTTKYLHIDDPIYGKSVMTHNQFATNYQGSGSWTHTYFTKKYFCFMWFKELMLNPKLLKPIPEIKPLINVYDKNIKIDTELLEGDYSIPHNTYLVELDSIKKNFSLPETPNSLRVIEIKNDKPMAMYEVGMNEDNPELMQMNVNTSYFDQLNEALGRLKAFAGKKKELGEIRLIKVPALNIDALWLHYDNKANDIITLIRRFEDDSIVDYDRAYKVKEFTSMLENNAKKIDTRDELLGA